MNIEGLPFRDLSVKINFTPVTSSFIMGFARHLPNFLTCLNLTCGCLAVVYIFRGEIPVFAALTAASLVLDFLDGFFARMLKAYSPLGKQLDSLADMVSFGLVPGAIMYHLMLSSVPVNLNQDEPLVRAVSFLPFIITVFSALRLAKFNIDTRQTDSFIGLPTPAATIFVTGLALILYHDPFHLTPALLNSYNIAGISMILAWLLVAELPLIALKFKSFSWAKNRFQYLLIVLSVASVVLFKTAGIPLVIILYIILSVVARTVKPTGQP
jgi:CDP-diacylglycerol---serine O-phosphatidyltransferase